MAYRSVTLNNGDTVRISESVLRGAGPEGPIGPAGPPGTATTIKGRVSTYASLPVNPSQGAAWVANDTGKLWAWDTTLPIPMWVDCGRIIGPAGVESIGAQRVRNTAINLVDGVASTVTFTSTTRNDADPLNTGNTDPAFGGVLSASSTSTSTIVWPSTYTYYLVTTTLVVQASVLSPSITVAWFNSAASTTSGASNVSSIEEGATLIHVALLRTKNTDTWQLRLTPTDDATVTSITTDWTRIGGGSGPTGPVGPAPTLTVGTVTGLGAGVTPTFSLVETTPGNYTVNVGLAQGAQGIAGSGYTTFNQVVSSGNSTSNPNDAGANAERSLTDAAIAVPAGTGTVAIPWYLERLATTIYRKLVGKLTTAARVARGSSGFVGDLVYDTDLKQLLLGLNTASGGDQWQIVPTIEYGTSTSITHGTTTQRPNGSLYFKHEA